MAAKSPAAHPSHWLLKTEPEKFSIQDLEASQNQTTFWNGIRNYQARNFLRDDVRLEDRVLLYHSGTAQPAVVGTAVVVRAGYPDHTALDPTSEYFDPKSTAENPIWYMIDIKLERVFPRPVTLEELRRTASLKTMELLRRGSRLSVQPVRAGDFNTILDMAEEAAVAAGACQDAKLAPGVSSRARNHPKMAKPQAQQRRQQPRRGRR
jgi:predicted RNA-binding protein with PUA-like domain